MHASFFFACPAPPAPPMSSSPGYVRSRPSYGVVCRKRRAPGEEEWLYCAIARRHSVGFLELVRGRWRCEDAARVLLADVPPRELEALRTSTFEELWKETFNCSPWRFRKDVAAPRFKALREALPRLLESVRLRDGTREWEFAKGKPKRRETAAECALREFQEETGVSRSEVRLSSPALAWEEHLGMDGQTYWNGFYLGEVAPHVVATSDVDVTEVKHAAWLTREELVRGLRREGLVDVLERLEAAAATGQVEKSGA